MEDERSQSQSLLAELEYNQITANSEISQSLLANDSEVISESPFESSALLPQRMIVEESQSQSLLAELEMNGGRTIIVLDSEEGKNLNAADSELMEVGQEANNIENSEEEFQHHQNQEIDKEEERLEEDEGEEEDEHEEDENTSFKINLPVSRIKKLMKICLQTNEIVEPDPEEQNNDKSKKGKQKGKGKVNTNSDGSTAANLILTKEAIYLTTVATELFVAAVTQDSSRVTASTKKKTMTVEHLKRALSGTDCYEFLQGCFHPSLIIGD